MSLMGFQDMKVHQFTLGLIWEHDEPPSLSLSSKRLRPLATKLATTTATTISSTFDLKSFIRPESGSRKIVSSDYEKKESAAQAEVPLGGTRWNPTQEQIGILEMLYRRGMRTPNAQQIEQITAQLTKYGKIEGKNVFYWFQNHKARERQKQKRNTGHSPRTPTFPFSTITSLMLPSNKGDTVEEESKGISYKRKCNTWIYDHLLEEDHSHCTKGGEDDGEDRTLKLFPLHPELLGSS